MTDNFLELARKRRTIYVLGKDIPVPENELIGTVIEAVKQAPSAFNSQSSRLLILLGEQHARFWELTREQLRKIVPAESFSATSDKIDGFAAAAGSILFFEDQDVVKALQEQFAAYADNFPVWSEHSTGIAQYAVWLALAEKGIGANLQHYNPLIDDDVRTEWNVPPSWKLCAHMNFGAILSPASEKAFMSDEKRFIVAKQL
ncbi:nitroreductase family protein [Pantoea dispersa]|uniref:nitroreductase family protein n=1 Tax=Pantoea dispersa TaxID=59814 RepID=UPI000FD78025|nr:nitroreductase family protein [Pantoea dispersa]RVU72224.1 nitroreductase family protein [Pantoea dispersa]